MVIIITYIVISYLFWSMLFMLVFYLRMHSLYFNMNKQGNGTCSRPINKYSYLFVAEQHQAVIQQNDEKVWLLHIWAERFSMIGYMTWSGLPNFGIGIDHYLQAVTQRMKITQLILTEKKVKNTCRSQASYFIIAYIWEK